MTRPASPNYVLARRGNRLRPSRLSTRYHALRQLADRFREVTASDALAPGRRLVDYGCAERPYEELFRAKFSEYVGADLPGNSQADITITEEGQLPLENETADCVLSSQVLEHVAEPQQYLREAWRVLRPRGQLLLSTHGNWQYHPDPHDYWRWTLEGLRYELEKAGFSPVLELAALGRTATTLQLLQDAVTAWMPGRVRVVPGFFFQRLIGIVEWFRTNPLPTDASVYVILATKSAAGPRGPLV